MKIEWLARDVGTIDDFLSPAECAALIAHGEELGFDPALISRRDGPVRATEVRNNDRVILDDPARAAWLWERLAPVLPPLFHTNWRASGLNERLRFYRYTPEQFFDWHSDGCFWRSQQEESHFTFMIYLNGDCEGGETTFRALPDRPDDDLIVVPREGMALLFHHPLWHRGSQVRRGRKYVLRTDIMYRLDADL